MPDWVISFANAANAVVDMRLAGLIVILTGVITLWKYRGLVDSNEHTALLGKVLTVAFGGGGAGAMAFVSLVRFLRVYEPDVCKELSRDELAAVYAFPVLVGAVSAFIVLRTNFGTPKPQKAPDPPPTKPAGQQTDMGTGTS